LLYLAVLCRHGREPVREHRIDTILINEGFGNLDSESGTGTLDQVLQVLGSLTEGSLAVGLFSHVGLAQEAIPQEL